MRNLIYYAESPLNLVLMVTVMIFGATWSNHCLSQATPMAFVTKQYEAGISTAPSVAEISNVTVQSGSEWRQTSGPEGGSISVLISDGPNLFAGTNSGVVFRLSDQGENWTTLNRGLPGPEVDALAVLGTNLFAGVRG